MMAKQAERMNQLQPRTLAISSGWSFPDYLVQRALLDRMARPPTFTAFNAALQVPGRPEPDPDVLLVARSEADRLQHSSTGTWYVKQGRLRPYDLFLKEAIPGERVSDDPEGRGGCRRRASRRPSRSPAAARARGLRP